MAVPKRTSGAPPSFAQRQQQQQGHNNGKFLIVLLVVLVGGTAMILWFRDDSSTTLTGLEKHSASTTTKHATPPPLLERQTIQGVNVLFQRPPGDGNIKGIVFLAHGCSHSHTDFFVSQEKICEECLGLPEEMAIVQLALGAPFHLAVVAISSQDRNSKCWNKQIDGPRVAPVLKYLADNVLTSNSDNKNISPLPILAFGASSGGSFVGSSLVTSMNDMQRPLAGYIAQIAAPTPPLLLVEQQRQQPIAVYITMNRDTRTDERAAGIIQELKPTKAKHIRLPPLTMSDSFFHDRIPRLTLDESEHMIQALKKNGFINDDEKKLMYDPRRRPEWRDMLRPHTPTWDTLQADQSPISEVMNVAWGNHEMSRDGVSQALEFIIGGY